MLTARLEPTVLSDASFQVLCRFLRVFASGSIPLQEAGFLRRSKTATSERWGLGRLFS